MFFLRPCLLKFYLYELFYDLSPTKTMKKTAESGRIIRQNKTGSLVRARRRSALNNVSLRACTLLPLQSGLNIGHGNERIFVTESLSEHVSM